MADLDVFRDVFVPNVQGFSKLSYTTWKNSNPSEAAKWASYRDAILAGGNPTPPMLVTKFGKALVAAGQLVQQIAPPPPPPPPPPSAGRLFAADSPINVPIGANPTVIFPYGIANGMGMGMNNNNAWSVAIFRDTSGSRRTVTGGTWHLDNVPLPPQFQAMWDAYNVANAEWHTVIIDSDRIYNIYKPNRDLTTASAMGCFRAIDVSRGTWNANLGPWCGRASGFSSALGCLLVSEFLAGQVDHALACSWSKARIASSGPVSPAVVSDGSGTLGAAGVVPMGTRLQLDPTLTDTFLQNNLGIPAPWLPVCHAMQTYGIFVCESSGGMSIYAEAWNDSGRTSGWTTQGGITSGALIPYFRAVAPPPLPVLDDRTVFGQPHQ